MRFSIRQATKDFNGWQGTPWTPTIQGLRLEKEEEVTRRKKSSQLWAAVLPLNPRYRYYRRGTGTGTVPLRKPYCTPLGTGAVRATFYRQEEPRRGAPGTTAG